MLDENLLETPYSFSKRSNSLLIKGILLFSVLSLIFICFSPLPDGAIQNLDGTYSTSEELQFTRYKAVVISFPFVGFLLGLFLSIIAFKKLTFNQKVPRFSLAGMFFMSVLGIYKCWGKFVQVCIFNLEL